MAENSMLCYLYNMVCCLNATNAYSILRLFLLLFPYILYNKVSQKDGKTEFVR